MQVLGHDGPPTNLWRENLVTGQRLDRCPVRTVQLMQEQMPQLVSEANRYVDVLHPAYVDKHLLIAGGINDQPMRYLDYMGAIGDIKQTVTRRFREITRENGGT
jgi:hypothetical protein